MQKKSKKIAVKVTKSKLVSVTVRQKCNALEVGHKSCMCGGEYCPKNQK
jgi:hypothetical protein